MKKLLICLGRGARAVLRGAWRVLTLHKDEVREEVREEIRKVGLTIGAMLALAAPGCGGLAQSDRTTSTSVWAIGVPGVAILREASMSPDNRGPDDNTATQVNTIDVEPKFK